MPNNAASSPPKPEPVPPSLKDLLRDLDKERLTGEEAKPLGVVDIDDIISRITSD